MTLVIYIVIKEKIIDSHIKKALSVY